MSDNLPRYTLRIPQILLDKLAYIAEYEGRTNNKEIEQLIIKRIPSLKRSTVASTNLIMANKYGSVTA